MSAIPGVLLSPLWFFAVLLPLFYRFKGGKGPGEGLLLAMAIYPLATALFFRFDPKTLLPMVIPIHIFGAASIVACGQYLNERFQIQNLQKSALWPPSLPSFWY